MRPTTASVLVLVTLALFRPTVAPAAEKTKIDFTVRDLKGKYLRLSDFKGKVVEVAFWATFCKACQKKLVHLEKWYRKYQQKGFVVLGVSVDGPESQSRVLPLVRSFRLSYPVVVDAESTISRLLNPKRATPFSVFIKDGKRLKTREGFQMSDIDGMEKELAALLK